MKKYNKILAILGISLCLFGTQSVYANDNFTVNSGTEKEFTIDVLPNDNTTNNPNKKEFKVDANIKEQKNKNNSLISEEEVKEILKEYKKENTKKNVSPFATPQSNAKGTIIENVGADNKPFPIRRVLDDLEEREGDENGLVERRKADARQFLTFTTKSGKVFHLIIDYDQDTENVSLVTEVSEADLLNMIEPKDRQVEVVKEEVKIEEPKVEVEKKEPKKSSMGSFVFIGIILAGIVGGGYYFKVIKPKKEEKLDEEELEDDGDDFFNLKSENNKNEEEDNED